MDIIAYAWVNASAAEAVKSLKESIKRQLNQVPRTVTPSQQHVHNYLLLS